MPDSLPGSTQKFVQSSDSTPPSVGGSMFNSFIGSAGALVNLGVEKGFISDKLPKIPNTSFDILSSLNIANYENAKEQELTTNNQMGFRKVMSAIPSMVGMAIDPVSMATGFAGGEVANVGIRAFLPGLVAKQTARKALIKEMGEKAAAKAIPRTPSEVVAAGAHGGAAMMGYAIPAATLESYNTDIRRLDPKQLATEVATNGAMGIGFGVVGYGLGVAWAKMFGRNAKVPMPGSPEVEEWIKALDAHKAAGLLSDEDYKLYTDALKDPNNLSVAKRFSKKLADEGHQVDQINDRAYFGMLTDSDMANLKSIFATEINNSEVMSEKAALSDFTLHNRLDEIREKPELIDGLRGSLAYLNDRLQHREAMTQAADKILDENIEKGLDPSMPFDQHDVFDTVYKQMLFHDKDMKEIPIEIPHQVEQAVKNVRQYELAEYKKRHLLDYEYKRMKAAEAANKGFYHGSSSLEDIKSFDVNRMDPNSLFGPGLYLTDSKRIAAGYSRSSGYKKSMPELLPGKIFKLKFKEKPNLVDIEKKPKIHVFKMIQEIARKHGYIMENEDRHLTLNKIYKKMRDALAKADIDDEYHFDMGGILKEINNQLELAGYDGFSHIGGQYIGKGKSLHNVVVLFGHEKADKTISNPAHKLTEESIDIGKDFEDKLESIRAQMNVAHPRETLLDAKAELFDIHEKLLTKDGLRKNFQQTKEYKRLVELSEVWHNAKALLDRINLEHDYERQEAFRDVAQAFIDVLDSNISNFADVKRVTDYLKERSDQVNRANGESSFSGSEREPSGAELDEIINESKRLPADHEALMADFQEQVDSVASPELTDQFKDAKRRYENFNENQEALEAMLDCFGRK